MVEEEDRDCIIQPEARMKKSRSLIKEAALVFVLDKKACNTALILGIIRRRDGGTILSMKVQLGLFL